MKNELRKRSTAGFTMAEMNIAVAILIIMFGLVAVGLVNLRLNLRQTELDAKAETIYVAAQNQLIKMRSAGNAGLYQMGSERGVYRLGANQEPFGRNSLKGFDSDGNPILKDPLCYMMRPTKAAPGSAAKEVLGGGVVSADLYGHYWIIEFDPQSCSVYAVFYSEEEGKLSDYQDNSKWQENYYSKYRDRDKRLNDGARVGYYGGDSVVTDEGSTLAPTVSISNKEKLTLTCICNSPKGADLEFTVTLSTPIPDSTGTKKTATYTLKSQQEGLLEPDEDHFVVGHTGNRYTYYATIVLDDLSSEATRFNNHFGTNNKYKGTGQPEKQLVPGEDLSITVEVRDRVNSGYGSVDAPVTNGLFADATKDQEKDASGNTQTAVIEYGRHLQNLDVLSENVSSVGVNQSKITGAVQTKDISFKKSADLDSWYANYCGNDNTYFNGKLDDEAVFKPITYSKLESYNGERAEEDKVDQEDENYLIEGINIGCGKTEPKATSLGLFSEVYGGTVLKNISLVGARVDGGDGVAATLVGTVKPSSDNGLCTIDNCHSYLGSDDVDKQYQKADDIFKEASWVKGKIVGGLVGQVDSGANLTITKSFASTVLNAKNTSDSKSCAGGLIGLVDGDPDTAEKGVSLEESYADSYIKGYRVGGLVGSTASTRSDVKIENCYAAGYLYPIKFNSQEGGAAGFVCGKVNSIKNSYTICAFSSEGAQTYSTAEDASTKTNVYYHRSGDYNIAGTSPIPQNVNEMNLKDGGDSAFIAAGSTTGADPYNLLQQGHTTYNYLYLKDNSHHYGDWETEFKSGSLVYYEKYASSNNNYNFSYGVYGIGYLSNSLDVVGDGYGLAYKASDFHTDYTGTEHTATIENAAWQTSQEQIDINLSQTDKYFRVRDTNGDEYVVFPLPKDKNHKFKSASEWNNFYQKIVVNDSTEGQTTYFYNPYVAMTVLPPDSENPETPAIPNNTVHIRTARQLYNLSRLYNEYRRVAVNSARLSTLIFEQGRDIDYRSYHWGEFHWDSSDVSGSGTVKSQRPIGEGKTSVANNVVDNFTGTYNGKCHLIEGISFESNTTGDSYIGFIGHNQGRVENVVLKNDYVEGGDSNYIVKRKNALEANDHVHMGVLVGLNGKGATIVNCAVSGYCLSGNEGTIYAYRGSRLYVGGLVGTNEGRIIRSASDCPTLVLSTLDAQVRAGGFAGRNLGDGSITDCYALGHIEVAWSRGGWTETAGFCAENEGSITSSYCGVSLISSGDTANTHGFAPYGGSVMQCKYLSNGTYYYLNHLRSYNASGKSDTTGDPYTLEQLTAAASPRVKHTYPYPNQHQGQRYPFTAVVTNGSDAYVHYGDWQTNADLGTVGVFYWELEEEGRNNGYHITFIGIDEKNGNLIKDSTLCGAHDDGGIITTYGYGYFTKGSATLSLSDTQMGYIDNNKNFQQSSSRGLSVSGSVDSEAQRKLQAEITGFKFYPYVTGTGIKLVDNGQTIEGDNHTDGTNVRIKDYNVREGAWRIPSTTRVNGQPINTYDFIISPYFADAMSLYDCDGIYTDGIYTEDEAKLAGSDGVDTIYTKTPGREDNQYEVRSVAQLQYINWNGKQENTSTYVKGDKYGNGNYMQYPYLQYASNSYDDNGVVKAGKQKKSVVEGKRPSQYWRQSHDVSATDPAISETNKELSSYTPIAALNNTSELTSYNAVLYAWFGGTYDGQSYKVQNLNISSDSYSVGLFGVLAGANIKNVILYSSNGNAIQRVTPGAQGSTYSGKLLQTGNALGSYAIGGLAAYAFDYDDADLQYKNKIENCAIAGYKVYDKSENQHTQGGGDIGGLLGVANINLKRCSSAVDIELRCTHDMGSGNYGNTIRVGMLAGSVRLTCEDCYTGGSINVWGEISDTEELIGTLYEAYYGKTGENKKYTKLSQVRNRTDMVRNYNTNIYVGGIAAGGFTCNFMNFTGSASAANTATPVYTNCYTYTDLPDVEGTIRAVTLIGSAGDRYGQLRTAVKFNNCYYLESKSDIKYWPNNNGEPLYYFSVTDGTHKNSENKNYIYSPLKLTDLTGKLEELEEAEQLQEGERERILDSLGDGANPFGNFEDDAFKAMVYGGDLRGLRIVLNDDTNSPKKPIGAPQIVDYDDLQSSGWADSHLNATRSLVTDLDTSKTSIWAPVTTTEGEGVSISGKYSFPGDRADLKGKDYPFPTSVTQPDLTFGDDVHVHYGYWPYDGVYWEDGLPTMDIFEDMDVDPESSTYGYATKILTIIDKNGSVESIDPDDITLTPGEGQYATVEDVTKVGNNYQVKIKAIKDGTVNVEVTTGGTTATCVLTITANLNVTALLTEEEFENFDPSSYTSAQAVKYLTEPNQETQVFLKAWAPSTTENCKDYTKSDNGAWKQVTSTNFSIQQEETSAGKYSNELTIGHATSIYEDLEAFYEYDYHGETYSASTFIPALTYGGIGLTDAPITSVNSQRVSVVTRASSATTQSNSDSAQITTSNKPNPPKTSDYVLALYENASDSELYDETTHNNPVDNGIEAVEVQSITLDYGENHLVYTPEPVASEGEGTYRYVSPHDPDGMFDVFVPASVGTDKNGNFEYRPIKILNRNAGTIPGVDVTVTLYHEEEGSNESEPKTTYALTLRGVNIPDRIVTYKAGFKNDDDVEESMVSFFSDGQSGLVLPKASDEGMFTREGYTFAGWMLVDENASIDETMDNTTVENPFSLAGVAGSLTFRAKWTPNTYVVRFYPNGGVDTRITGDTGYYEQAGSFTYDEAKRLESVYGSNSTPCITREGFKFVGWARWDSENPEDVPSVAEFADNQEVINLATGGAAELIAVWETERTLVLDYGYDADGDGQNDSQSLTVYNQSSATDGYDEPSRAGFVLEGWSDDPYGGNIVLTADGVIADNLPGYTDYAGFDPNQLVFALASNETTLYARWIVTLWRNGTAYTYDAATMTASDWSPQFDENEPHMDVVGSQVTKPTDANELKGYKLDEGAPVLDGWYWFDDVSDPQHPKFSKALDEYGNPVDGATTPEDANVTFYAGWKNVKYQVIPSESYHNEDASTGYNPNGAAFKENISADILDFGAGDYVTTTMNLQGFEDDDVDFNNNNNKYNIISLGKKIDDWNKPLQGIHVFVIEGPQSGDGVGRYIPRFAVSQLANNAGSANAFNVTLQQLLENNTWQTTYLSSSTSFTFTRDEFLVNNRYITMSNTAPEGHVIENCYKGTGASYDAEALYKAAMDEYSAGITTWQIGAARQSTMSHATNYHIDIYTHLYG